MLLSALRLTRLGFRSAWIAGVVALIVLTMSPALLGLAGFDIYTVRGGSMSPDISIGSVVVVQHTSPAAVAAGDVITFRAPNAAVVTHRVLGRSAGPSPTFITQGDANAAPDADMVPADSVIGRVVFSVPFAGAILVALSTTAGVVIVAALLVSLMVAGWFVDELRTLLSAPHPQRAATKLGL